MSSEAPPTVTNLEAARMLAPGSLLGERYRILELLGVGGMGMVYRARDEQLDVEVAVKLLRAERAEDAEILERFRQELLLARQVSHRNVVRIHDIGRHGDLLFLTMDYVPGRSLRQVLEEEGPLDIDRAVAIARQLAEALDAAHREGIVHRDLKPANILIDAADRAYITDFGIARSLSGPELTRTGNVLGTPDYLSPEQARGEKVDHRSDLYAFGLILFEMVSGHQPFAGGTLAERLARRISGHPSTLEETGTEVPKSLRAVVEGCLTRAPEERYQSASEIVGDLGGPTAGRPRRRRIRWRAEWFLLPLAAVLLLVAGGRVVRQLASPPEDDPAGVASAPRHAVAVLPLADEIGRAELAWLPAGIADMLAAELAESPDLQVSDSLRVFRTLEDLKLPRGPLPAPDLRLLADLLDADRLVVGRVRSTATGLRVDAQLIAVGGGDEGPPAEPVSAEIGDEEDIPRLVERLASQLRRHLGVPPPRGRPPPLSSSAAALGAYADGVQHALAGDSLAAAPALERAVSADPGFTAAQARLAAVYEALGYRDKALVAVERAARLAGSEGGRLGYEIRARRAALTGDTERAREILSERVARYPHDVVARAALGEALGEAGNFEAANAVLRQVVGRNPSHPRAWYLLGKHAILQGESRRAIDEYLVHALVVQNRLGNAQGRADVLNAMGAALEELGELAQAAERYREAADLRRRIGDLRGYSATLSNLAAIQALEGDYDTAVETLGRALELREEIGDQAGIAHLLNQFGMVEEQRGRYREALEHFLRGLAIRRALGDDRALAESHNNVGFAHYLLGEFDEAAGNWSQALELFETSGNREGAVFARQSMGQLALARGDWSAALQSFLAALEESRDLGLANAEAVSLGYLGRVAHYQGRFGAALAYYREALDLLAPLGDPRGLAEFTLFEAETLLALGMAEPAGRSLERAEPWLAASGNREQRAAGLCLDGARLLLADRQADARAAFERAREVAAASGSRLAEIEARLGLGRAELAGGKPGAALAILEPAAAAAESLGYVPLRLAAGIALVEAHFAAGRLAPAETAARDALRLAAAHEPFASTYRLHLLLARVLEARGRGSAAAAEMALAAVQIERLRSHLEGETATAFNRLPEVQTIVREADSDPANRRG